MALQLRDVVMASDGYRRAEAAGLGIGVTEAVALGELHHHGPLSPSALVTRLGIASASVTALLDRLTAAGLIVRERHPTDRRSVLVVLTPRGRRTTSAMSALYAEAVLAAVREAHPEHVREFTAVLADIAASLRRRAADPATVADDLARRAGEGEADASPGPVQLV
ncbi:MarR family winged helix-turn-helix transcriptional regulator [Pseudonocardia alni]|uniref:MarR family winged helix-turn-helix transcriptional regulator n=1 Tax=Pseudonocardia alni TaxID=33907 RepID=UPI003319A258